MSQKTGPGREWSLETGCPFPAGDGVWEGGCENVNISSLKSSVVLFESYLSAAISSKGAVVKGGLTDCKGFNPITPQLSPPLYSHSVLYRKSHFCCSSIQSGAEWQAYVC